VSQVGSSVIPDFGPAWDIAYKKAKAKVRCMTVIKIMYYHHRHSVNFSSKVSLFSLEEKVSVATGVGWMNGRCVVNLEYSWKSKCD